MTESSYIYERVERIAAACRAWNAQAKVFIPHEIANRHAMGRSLRVVLKTLIGLAFVPPKNAHKQIVLFQGLRNQHLFSLFPKDQIYLLGSWTERDQALKNGYGFIPVFPIECSIQVAVYRDIAFVARQQMRRWRRWLAGREVTVLLYEDTQPIGAFFALFAEPDSPNYRAVCIQHGHYPAYTSPYRPEGRLTEYNLVWDTQQGEWISENPDKTRVIGLPYQAASEPPSEGPLRVVFVGLGSISHQAMSFDIFRRIAIALRSAFERVEIAYRPHPNEFNDRIKIAECELLFGRIDRTPKVELLNGPWTLFVGEVSSLLFEAKQAGHLTAFVPIDPKNIPTGYHDITLDPDDLEAALVALRRALKYPPLPPTNSAAAGNPVYRFVAGAASLGLLPKAGSND